MYLNTFGLEREAQRGREIDRERERERMRQAFLLFTTRAVSGDIAESDTSYMCIYNILSIYPMDPIFCCYYVLATKWGTFVISSGSCNCPLM